MPHVDALHEIDHALGDVAGMVADAFQTTRRDQMIERPFNSIRFVPHNIHHLALDICAHRIHAVIGREHLLREAERSRRTKASRLRSTKDSTRAARSVRWIGRMQFRLTHQRQPARGDVDSEIAHSLQIGADFDGGHNKPHVTGNRLFECDQAGGRCIDPDLAVVDNGLIAHDLVGLLGVAFHQRENAAVNGLCDHPSHLKEGLIEA